MLLEDPTDMRRGPQAPVRARPIVVQKYGGSSVADVDKLGRVADRVVATKKAGNDVVVVVSAMGKTTDGLLELASKVAVAGKEGSAAPRRELDMLVSTGERVSMSLLSIAIQARGLDAISFTGSQCGIITNDRHFDARIIEVRPHRIEDELARGRVVIVAGYQGMSYRREITTLGRGGTDTTAVALAAALEADRCEIYSDVDGVYSADPRAVADARHLPEMDYATLQEMSHSGAKVLCAQAVEFARRSGIAIFARSTFDEVSDAPRQTIVRKYGPGEQPTARAVTCDAKVAWLELQQGEQLAAVLDWLAARQITVAELSATDRGAALLLSLVNAPDWPAARAELGSFADGVALREEVALISIIGGGLNDRPDMLSRFRQVLHRCGAAPLMLQASALRLAAIVDGAQAVAVQQGLHAEFV